MINRTKLLADLKLQVRDLEGDLRERFGSIQDYKQRLTTDWQAARDAGRTAEALRVAEFENSVIKLEKDYETRYAKLTDENFILVNMAQSAYVKYSERFAEMLHEEVKRGKQMSSKGVKQAGFYVLVGASMPSVLIEMGFLSNAREEQYLATQEGQQHMAERFFEAIRSYAEEYEKSLQE